MALSCGQHPDHSTIAAFVATMQEEIQPLFRDVLLACEEMGLLGGTEFALNGCKLPGNASKKWSGTFTVLKEKQGKLERRVQQLMEEQVAADRKEGEYCPEGTTRSRRGMGIKFLRLKNDDAEKIKNFVDEHLAEIQSRSFL